MNLTGRGCFQVGNKMGERARGIPKNRHPRIFYELKRVGMDRDNPRMLSHMDIELLPRVLLSLSKDELQPLTDCGVVYIEKLSSLLLSDDTKGFFTLVRIILESPRTPVWLSDWDGENNPSTYEGEEEEEDCEDEKQILTEPAPIEVGVVSQM